MANIVNASPVNLARPKHVTLTGATAEALRKAIREGSFAPGSQLPPEKELIAMLGVSRTTVREALKALEEQGLIERRRGLGTYVCEAPIVKDLSINFGISEMIAQAGLVPGDQASEIRRDQASAAIAATLEIAEGAPIIIVDRVRTANKRPVVWSVDILPSELLGSPVPEDLQLESQSLYQCLHDRFGIRVVRGVAQLCPVLANRETAGRLGVRRGSPLMRITQTDYDAANRAVLYSVEYHLPDSVVFLINRKGPHW